MLIWFDIRMKKRNRLFSSWEEKIQQVAAAAFRTESDAVITILRFKQAWKFRFIKKFIQTKSYFIEKQIEKLWVFHALLLPFYNDSALFH